MVCSLHYVTTGSRDRANVSLIIIIILIVYRTAPYRNGTQTTVTALRFFLKPLETPETSEHYKISACTVVTIILYQSM